MVFLRFPNGRPKAVTFSYDDGIIHDKRLAEIFDKYGMKATFNLNCEEKREFFYTKEELHEYFLSKGHEIAIHGALHKATGFLRPIEGIQEILKCRLELEDKCDRIIRGMAYPDTGIRVVGQFCNSEEIKNYLKELDIAYARSLGGDNSSFLLPDDFLAWLPSAHHNNPKIMEYIDRFLKFDFSPTIYYNRRHPRLLYIWGHSYEFENKNNWEHIDYICKRLSGYEDIWYATNIEICDYVEAYKRLVYSANGKMIYNPTVTEVWIDVDGVLHSIKPGETIRL